MQFRKVLPVAQTIYILHRLVRALAQLVELGLTGAALGGSAVPDVLIRNVQVSVRWVTNHVNQPAAVRACRQIDRD